jgi:hypothetical protein
MPVTSRPRPESLPRPHRSPRQGATLPEALVAVVLTAALAGLAWSLTAGAQSRLRDRAEREGLTRTLITGADVLTALLESAGTDSLAGPDLLAAEPDRTILRVTRAAGFACDVTPARVTVWSLAARWTAIRESVPGRDTILLRRADGAWATSPLLGPPASGTCPDGAAGLGLPASLAPGDIILLGSAAPVRIVETVEARLYASGGQSWLGLRSPATGEVIQPLAGPLLRASGLSLLYLDRDGAPTTDPGRIRAVRFTMRAVGSREHGIGIARSAAGTGDTLTRLVALRNLPPP